MPNNYANDEALARALQAEFERERNRQERSRQNRRAPQPSAPPEHAVRGQRRTESDEEYARRIAQEEERLYQYRQNRPSRQDRESNQRNQHDNTSNSNTRAPSNNVPRETFTSPVLYDVKSNGSDDTPATSIMEYEDAEYARRVEQELLDEELARRMQEKDEQRASQFAAQQAATQAEPRPRFTFNCLCGYLMCFTFLAAAAIAFVYFFYIQDNDLPGRWIWDPEQFAEEDPFDAKGPEDVTPWRSNGRGLTVEVLNALDEEWHPFFYEAILDWDGGYPDSLTLPTSTTSPDSACSEVSGKVKVCNGNYGQTSWKGINEVHIDGSGYIYASTARLNDFYFKGNTGSMQYTMCHELGHAWGLPHTDEIFGNKDLGNCMDYTHNEDENKRPDASNFDFLYHLYGLVPGAEPYTPPSSAPTVSPPPTAAPLPELEATSEQIDTTKNNVKDEGKDDEKDQGKPGKNGKRALQISYIEEDMQSEIFEIRERLMSGNDKGVRLLYRGVHGEIHEAEMSNGHRLRVHKLLHIE